MRSFIAGLLLLLPAALPEDQPLTSLTVGSFRITFDSTTRAAAIVALGPATAQTAGDAGNSVWWVCYGLDHDKFHLRLESYEVSGATVGGFWLGPVSFDTAAGPCLSLATPLSEIRTDRGIFLGQPRRSAEGLLGQPRAGNEKYAMYELQRRPLYSLLTLRYRRGVVDGFEGEVTHIE